MKGNIGGLVTYPSLQSPSLTNPTWEIVVLRPPSTFPAQLVQLPSHSRSSLVVLLIMVLPSQTTELQLTDTSLS